jgi:hypothetical protein
MMAAKRPGLARKQDSTARYATGQFAYFRVYRAYLGKLVETYRQEEDLAGEDRTAKGT